METTNGVKEVERNEDGTPTENVRYAYESKQVNDKCVAIIHQMRWEFSQLEKFIDSQGVKQNPRYLALAKTHLETAQMWATKSFTHTES